MRKGLWLFLRGHFFCAFEGERKCMVLTQLCRKGLGRSACARQPLSPHSRDGKSSLTSEQVQDRRSTKQVRELSVHVPSETATVHTVMVWGVIKWHMPRCSQLHWNHCECITCIFIFLQQFGNVKTYLNLSQKQCFYIPSKLYHKLLEYTNIHVCMCVYKIPLAQLLIFMLFLKSIFQWLFWFHCSFEIYNPVRLWG